LHARVRYTVVAIPVALAFYPGRMDPVWFAFSCFVDMMYEGPPLFVNNDARVDTLE
jgi:hypothetical protein